MAFDKHMNMVLGDCEEWRKIKLKRGQAKTNTDEKDNNKSKEQKRMLGLVILRGENIVSITVESPPVRGEPVAARIPTGPGRGVAAGRGAPMSGPPPGQQQMGMPPPGLGGFGRGQAHSKVAEVWDVVLAQVAEDVEVEVDPWVEEEVQRCQHG